MPATIEPGYETLDNSSRPLNSIHVPGVGVVAVQGGTASTDALGVQSAPIAVSAATTVTGDAMAATGLQANTNLLWNGATYDRTYEVSGDGMAATGLAAEPGMLYNGSTFDRQRGNIDNITVLASAARTTTQTQADQTNYNHRGIIVVLDMTTVGTGSVTLEIDGKDPVSGKYYALLTGAAVTTNSTNVYRVYPGLTAAANATANDVLPRTWRIKVTANNANSATYSVGAMILL
jgi:hypothetical protein